MALPELLKKAIIQMPAKEKDKLLLRLVTKDKALSDRLHFELIEGSATIPERREDLMATISRTAGFNQNTINWVLADLRTLSSDIAYHVKVTKDKAGGIELNLFLLNTFMDKHEGLLRTYSMRTDKCAIYIVKKAQAILNGINKMEEDYRTDYLGNANKMLSQIYSLCTKMYARQFELPSEID